MTKIENDLARFNGGVLLPSLANSYQISVDSSGNPIKTNTVVRAASVGSNISLTGTQTVDGVALVAGDIFLAKDQTTGSQNGIYTVASSAWTRTADPLVPGMEITISSGTLNALTTWEITNTSAITVGTTAITFKRSDGSWDEWETTYVGSALLAASAAAGNWLMRYDGGTPLISTAAQNAGTSLFYLDPAQYAVTGKTIQVRLAAYVFTNSTAPGITFTFGLYPITASAAFVLTLAAASTTVAIATPALNTRTPGWGAAISMPAAGAYVLGCTTSGINAAATQILGVGLQMRAI